MATQYLDKAGLELLVTNIKAEDKKITDKIGTVPTTVGTTPTATVIAYVDAKTAAEATTARAAEKANADAIDALEALVGTTAVATQISTAVSNATGANSQLAKDVAANKSAISTLNGTGAGSVANTVATKIAEIVNDNNNGSIDTLNEIAAWIVNDTTGAAKMAADIAALQTANGETNVIETVKVNNTALTVTNKAVNIDLSGYVPTTRKVNNKALSSDVTLGGADVKLTSYTKASAVAAVAATDTVNAAIGKLEKALDGKQASGSYASATHNHVAADVTDFATEVAKVKVSSATAADSATKATKDGSGNVITSTYLKVADVESITESEINALFA